MASCIYGLLPQDQAKAQKAEAAARIPMKRVGDPREIADAALFLASAAASYTTGQTFAVDGGSLLT